MNQWLTLLRTDIDLEVVSPGQVLQRMVRGDQPVTTLAPTDDPSTFSSELREPFQLIGYRWARVEGSKSTDLLIVDRRKSDGFFSSSDSEIAGSGAERRSTPNMDELAERLKTQAVDFADTAPVDQIRRVARSRVLIAQHGAALANMIWMTPGSKVIEIQPPMGTQESNIFRSLARACDLSYEVVYQRSNHSEVDVEMIMNVARTL